MTPTTLDSVHSSNSAARRRAAVREDPPTTLAGIVLAGSYQGVDTAFSGLLPRPLVPIAQAPLVSYALRWLSAADVASVKLCTNGHSRVVDAWLTTGGWRRTTAIDFLDDPSPRGPAGSARDAALACDADTFVVVEGTVIPVLDLQEVLDEHRRKRATMTAVVHEQVMGRSAGARVATPAGIYVFSRRAFDAVAKTGFQDIKDHLIPALRRRGERLVAFAARDNCPRVLNAETYLAVNHWVIEQLPGNDDLLAGREIFCRTGELIAHPTAEVHPTATIIGPTILGPGASIGAGATVVGPTSIGARTVVANDAVVCRSVVWADCEIGARAFVDHAVVSDHVKIPAGAAVHREVKMRVAPRWRFGMNRIPRPHAIKPAPVGSVADLVWP